MCECSLPCALSTLAVSALVGKVTGLAGVGVDYECSDY